MNLYDLSKFRRELVESGLVAWSRPFYQVLALPRAGENRPDFKEAPRIPHDGGDRLVPGNEAL